MVACPSPHVTVLPHLNIFSKTVVSSISGGISTLPLPVLPGPGGMAVWRPVLIFLVCRFRGCLLFLHVILSLVLFRTIVVCVSRSRHNGQVPTCRKCNHPGHFSNVCPNRVCFNCEGLGHEARDCPCPVLCCLCKEEGHLGINCIYSWFCPSVSSCNIVPCPFSDHCGVCLSLSIPDVVPPGPGFWKLNTSVLDDPVYVALISDAWSSWRRSISRFPSLVKWWDAGKSLVKGLTIRFCCHKSSARSGLRDLLVRLIDHLKSKVDLGSSSCLGPYHSALAELAAMDFQAARGAQVRSRAKWVEEGESSSAYFLRLERKHGSDRWISALRDRDGSIVSSPPDLCTSLSSFYSDLFSASSVDPQVQADLLENLSSSLSGGQSSLCEGHLTVDEVLSALRGMARRKAPGLDGLPMEFYLKFWPVVGADLVSVLNSCFDSGSLSLSQRRGVISLSFKKGDRLDPRNWRPITLLNVGYKLASRAIAGRLLKVIHLLVAEDQTCGVPGRFIGENVALLRDVVSFASSSRTPVAILSLDQEKAFDRVDWGFMRSTLVAMGFGPSFVTWVDLFYHRVQSCVNVNGYVSAFFNLSRGVRQGCPLSPLLYVLVSEVLAANIRCNSCISGLLIPGFPPLSPISQYADDTSLIVSSDDAIKAVFETYALFERASGSKLTQAKSKGLWLGGCVHWCWGFRC